MLLGKLGCLDGKFKIRWQLMFYDVVIYAIVITFIVTTYGLAGSSLQEFTVGATAALLCLLVCRTVGKVYSMIIRYGGVHVYMRLFATDLIALCFYWPLKYGLGLEHMTSQRWLIIMLLNLLGAVGMRLMYRYCYRFGVRRTKKGEFLRWLLLLFAGDNVIKERRNENKRIRIAILGAGRLGAVLADELLSNDSAAYVPVCFIDQDSTKTGREVMGLPVLAEGEDGLEDLKDYGVQEIVFAITNIINTKKDTLFKLYKAAGYKVKVYDFSVADVAKSGKRMLREFDIDELLFRQPIVVNNELVSSYYKDKVILVTGGGGSIGSEMCRQVAKMSPKQIIALDIYENGVYDLQQELRLLYGDKLNFKVEIASICSESAMCRVMEEYHPDILIHAAAHKHVPLMEKNCIEAVENNVFGTLNCIELCEEYGVGRFMMVSTDKAVNPTNIMGATKRMCEIIARAHSAQKGNKVVFSDTRFGNVLGSAGSVIPLFKRQIANGGPITITDKRIIRYFMTIPEASQLVLHSGAIAKNGELFVLDMGQPVKIYDLAVNMIKLSGLEPYKDIDIIETGLRPGEKLYEELLIKSETLDKTDNKLVFIEKDEPIGMEELERRLQLLREALATNSDEAVKAAISWTNNLDYLYPTGVENLIWALVYGVVWAIVVMVSPWQTSRYLMAKNEHTVMRASVWASIGVVSVTMMLYFSAAFVYAIKPDLEDPSTCIIWAAMHCMPLLVGIIMLTGILSAGISSASTFLSLIGTSLTNDILQKNELNSVNSNLLYSRIIMGLVSILILGLAYFQPPQIFWIMYFGGTVIASAWGLVAITSVWFRNMSESSAFLGMLLGFLGCVITKGTVALLSLKLPIYLDPFFVGMLLSIIGMYIGQRRGNVSEEMLSIFDKMHLRPDSECNDKEDTYTHRLTYLYLGFSILLATVFVCAYAIPYSQAVK